MPLLRALPCSSFCLGGIVMDCAEGTKCTGSVSCRRRYSLRLKPAKICICSCAPCSPAADAESPCQRSRARGGIWCLLHPSMPPITCGHQPALLNQHCCCAGHNTCRRSMARAPAPGTTPPPPAPAPGKTIPASTSGEGRAGAQAGWLAGWQGGAGHLCPDALGQAASSGASAAGAPQPTPMPPPSQPPTPTCSLLSPLQRVLLRRRQGRVQGRHRLHRPRRPQLLRANPPRRQQGQRRRLHRQRLQARRAGQRRRQRGHPHLQQQRLEVPGRQVS